MSIQLLQGDCRQVLQTMPERSVQCAVTSPPYYGLRRYSDDPREIGQEAAPDCLSWARREPPCGACYVCAMRDVFAQLWRVLRDDGTCWLNLGDSYAGSGKGIGSDHGKAVFTDTEITKTNWREMGVKSKDLLGIPWRVALALQADGWYLRSDIIWSKPNCMPESVTDRPTRAHEYVFLLAKSARYFYDAAAIAEPIQQSSIDRINQPSFDQQTGGPKDYGATGVNTNRSMRKTIENFKTSAASGTRNRRTVWSIATQPYSGAHYATMPEALIEPCILAGSSAQACEHCGAAWVRVVEREELSTRSRVRNVGGRSDGLTRATGPGKGFYTNTNTTGFAPSCACPENTGSAASVVLDPFSGSGTVSRVAIKLGRRAIGIELNQEYIEEHIEKRTNGVQTSMVGLL